MVYFIGCLHLLHEGVAKWRGFSDSWEHDEWLIKNWNSVVNKRDKVFIVGDVTMEKSAGYDKLDELNGIKEVVMGNHDRGTDVRKLLDHVEKVSGMVDYNGFTITHCPIHPCEVNFYRGNIHAHIHHENQVPQMQAYTSYNDPGSKLVDTQHKYVNVDAKVLGFKPISFDEVVERVKINL